MTQITPVFAILMAMLFLVPGEVLARDDRFEPEYSNNAGPRGEIRVTNDWRDEVRVTMWTHRRERIGGSWVLEPGESAFLAVDEDRIKVRPSYKIKVGSDWGWVDLGSVGRFRRGVWYVNVRDIWRATHQREGGRDRNDPYERRDPYDRHDPYDRYNQYDDVPGGEDRRGGDGRQRREGYRRYEDDPQRGGMQPVQPVPPPRSIQPPPPIRPIQPPLTVQPKPAPTIQPIQPPPTVQPKPAPTIQPIQPPPTVQPKPTPTIQPIQPPPTVQPKPAPTIQPVQPAPMAQPKPVPREPKRDQPDEFQVQQVVPMNGK